MRHIWRNEEELGRLRAQLGEARIQGLWAALRERALAQTAQPGLMQPGDTLAV